MPIYAVARGHEPGIYTNAQDFSAQMSGYPHCKGRRFASVEKAENWLQEHAPRDEEQSDKTEELPDDVAAAEDYQMKQRRCWPNYFSDEDKRPIVFTDGSCTFWAESCGVFWGLGHSDNVAARIFSVEPDNNRAECMAVIVAVAQAIQKGFGAIQIVTDALYLVKIIEIKKITNCKKKMGKTNDLLEQLFSLMQQIDVKFVFVHGHKYAEQYEPWQVAGNRMAHSLARRGRGPEPSHYVCDFWMAKMDGQTALSLLQPNTNEENIEMKCITMKSPLVTAKRSHICIEEPTVHPHNNMEISQTNKLNVDEHPVPAKRRRLEADQHQLEVEEFDKSMSPHSPGDGFCGCCGLNHLCRCLHTRQAMVLAVALVTAICADAFCWFLLLVGM